MKQLKLLSILFVVAACITSCSKDDDTDNSGFDGSIDEIENFYTPELLVALDTLGFNLNIGNTPPIIDGTYLANPVVLTKSNRNNDIIGQVYADLEMTFSNQNND